MTKKQKVAICMTAALMRQIRVRTQFMNAISLPDFKHCEPQPTNPTEGPRTEARLVTSCCEFALWQTSFQEEQAASSSGRRLQGHAPGRTSKIVSPPEVRFSCIRSPFPDRAIARPSGQPFDGQSTPLIFSHRDMGAPHCSVDSKNFWRLHRHLRWP